MQTLVPDSVTECSIEQSMNQQRNRIGTGPQFYVPEYVPDTCHCEQIYVLKYVHIRPNLCTYMCLNTYINPYPNTYNYVPTNTYQNTYHYGVYVVVRIFGYYVPTMDRHNP